jgi:small subunit ribosomal protein S17
MKKQKLEVNKKEEKNLVRTSSEYEKDCPFHGNLKVRGRTFKGVVIKKFYKRVVIEFERRIYVKKYERYAKLKTKLHARLPSCINNDINIGDYIKISECRPLSKIIHFVVINKIKNSSDRINGVKK